jgi:energy-coupling factor transporter ATP-binding protein EcfA2
VAIAAALAADPVVVALDEPTRGMDPARRGALVGLLRRHAARGRAAVVATHDAELAALVGDREIALDGAAQPREAVPA